MAGGYQTLETYLLSPSYTVTLWATIHPNLSQMVKSGCVGMEKKKISINTVSHDAPTVSPQFMYGSTTTHDDRATIHHNGARNAHNASMIRCSASMIQAGSATVV